MFDMRYHIASLVAVFLALTVGLLLGSLIVDKGVLAKQQERLVASIKTDIDKINAENRSLQTKVEQLQNFQDQVFPLAVRNRLVDTRVAIATFTDGQDELVAEIDKSLVGAGAKTSALHLKVNGLNFSDKTLINKLGASFGATDTVGGDFERRFWARLAGELAGRDPQALLNELASSDLIRFDSASLPMENLVLLAGGKKDINSREALFLDALTPIGQIRAIGAETGATQPSRVAAYKLRNVSSIDNIDTVPGKISLVYLLDEREVTAHFGLKATADKFLPN